MVYRAMRKQYGTEKVQDECLRVFKVIYPLYQKAQRDGVFEFDRITHERLGKIFSSWNVQQGSRLDDLLFAVRDKMINEEFTRESFVEFCDDVMVVVMRIRKLTERECGRLMSVDEKSLDIMLNCGVSKSALYKLFGNSICAGTGTKYSQGNYDGVLFNIFRKLFIETGPDIVKGTPTQLSLF